MDLKQKYTEVNKYFLEEKFLENLEQMDRGTATRIAEFIDDNIWFNQPDYFTYYWKKI